MWLARSVNSLLGRMHLRSLSIVHIVSHSGSEHLQSNPFLICGWQAREAATLFRLRVH